MHELDTGKIWANSGDSHFLEPEDLWTTILPAKQAARMPRSEKISDDEEIVHVDGESFHRKLPAIMTKRGADGLTIAELSVRPPGARDMRERVKDLDHEGVWGEVMYASLGLWSNMINDQTLVREAAHAQNEWMVSEIKSVAPDRLVPAGQMPLLSVDDAVAEIHHIADIGLHIASLPTGVAPGMPDWNDNTWEPLWAAAEEAGIVLGFHIGTDGGSPVVARGPGGAVINYVETTYGGQKVATKLVASGALDRHPNLRVLISEGGATWVPFLGDRMKRGLSPARNVRAPDAQPAPQGDPVQSGLRVVPARRIGAGRQPCDGLRERDVGQRLPASRGHVRAHPEDAPRAVRRLHPRGARADHQRRVPRTVPARVAAAGLKQPAETAGWSGQVGSARRKVTRCSTIRHPSGDCTTVSW